MEMHSDSPLMSRGYSQIELLALEPVHKEIQGKTLIFTMGQPDPPAAVTTHKIKPLEAPLELSSDLDLAVAKLVAERRADFLSVVTAEFSAEQPEIHISDKSNFARQIRDISAGLSGLAGEDPEKLRALVTQKCLKELWPVLCLNESLKKLSQSYENLENTSHVIPKGKISKQFRNAVKTTSVFLETVKRIDNLPLAKIEEKAWETQKLLTKTQDLQAKLEELQISPSEKKVQHEFSQLDTQVQNLIKEMGGIKRRDG